MSQALALMSRIVRDPKKLEFATNLPILAILPLDEHQLTHVDTKSGAYLLAKQEPNSASIEALRSLRIMLIFKLSEKERSKVVLITSAVSGQGKSFISNNLCYLLAATGKNILFIDADIRLSTLHNYIDIDKNAPGLSSILKGELKAENVIIHGIAEGLDYLPLGRMFEILVICWPRTQ